jgi:hypothetical protein
MDQDAIFFTGTSHSALLMSLSQKSHFFSLEDPTFIQWNPPHNFKLQLDSNVVFYKTVGRGVYKLHEQYSIQTGAIIINEIGTWNSTGLFLSKQNMWDRRSDLRGLMLRNAVVEWPYMTDLIYNNQRELVGSKGKFQETLFHLRDALNFTIETVKPGCELFGSLNKDNNTWNGLMGMLVNNRADIASPGKFEADLNMDFLRRVNTVEYSMEFHGTKLVHRIL